MAAPEACRPMLIASYLAALLLVVILYLLHKFLSQKKKHTFALCLVIVMMTNDVLANAAHIGNVHKVCLGYKWIGKWPTCIAILAKAVGGLCEHLYLIRRFYLMSKNVPLTVFLVALSAAHALCHLTVACTWLTSKVPLSMIGKGVQWGRFYKLYVSGWSLAVAVDTLVAAGIAWQLMRLDVVYKSTKGMVRKFLLTTVLCGGLTAMSGIVLLTLLVQTRYEYIIVACNFEKIYVITVYTNLAVAHSILERPAIVAVSIGGQAPTWTTSVLAVFNRQRVPDSKDNQTPSAWTNSVLAVFDRSRAPESKDSWKDSEKNSEKPSAAL
jgi:hypothetical protein